MNEWINNWRLKININNSNFMQFQPSHKGCILYNFKHNGQEICAVSLYKYLGVYMDFFKNIHKCCQNLPAEH